MAKTKPQKFVFWIKEKPVGKKVNSPCEIYERMKKLAKADQESFWVIGLNERRQEVTNVCIAIGGVSSAQVDISILFKRLFTAGASSFIVVHNHPGGECEPSRDDRNFTKELTDKSEILGLSFIDHVIISDDGYYSFKA